MPCSDQRAYVTKATSILKSDIDRLPYPEDESSLDMASGRALLEDTLGAWQDTSACGQKADIAKLAARTDDLASFSAMFTGCSAASMTRFRPALRSCRESRLPALLFQDRPDLKWLNGPTAGEALRKPFRHSARDPAHGASRSLL